MSLHDLLNWPVVLDALTLGALYALIAVGYTLVYGIIKLINFAHGEVLMIGTYATLLVTVQLGVPVMLSVLVAMAACAALGLVIDFAAYLPLRRQHPLADFASIGLLLLASLLAIAAFEVERRGAAGAELTWIRVGLALLPGLLFLLALLGLTGRLGRPRATVQSDRLSALITAIGMSLSLQTIAQLLWTADYRNFPAASLPSWLRADVLAALPASIGGPIAAAGASVQGKEVAIWAVTAVLMVGLGLLVGYTRVGRAMRACALDKDTAALMGVNVNAVIGVTFCVGSALAAIAGALFAIKVGGNISPRMGYYPGVIAFAAAVLGGIGSIRGAVVGGLLIGFTQALGGRIASAYDFAFAFGLMILVILFRPWGLFGSAGGKRA